MKSRKWARTLASVVCFAHFGTALVLAQPAGRPAGGGAAAGAAKPSVDIGAVRPSNLVLPQIAISERAGSGVGSIISADLALADIATPPVAGGAVTAALATDRQAGADFPYDIWTQAGVSYVVRVASGQEGSAQAELYDLASKQRVFGKTYSGRATATSRALAHKIADDVMTALTNRPGIFSSMVCYLGEKGRGSKEVMVMDADGANGRQLTRESSIVATPCWGQNGAEVIYTTYRDNNPDLAGTTLAGRRFDVIRRPGLNTAPSWNAALSRLAVSLSKDGNSEIYTMTREGRSLARVTNNPDADTAPDWSPDGGRIAFTSNRGGSPQIYVMDAGGGGARKVSSGNYCDSPSWSPDGAKIAYVVRESGEFNVYVADLAGGPQIQLTRGQRDNTDPSWGPDSRHLVFASNRTGSREIFMISLDTKTAKQLTRGGGATSPAWGPLQH